MQLDLKNFMGGCLEFYGRGCKLLIIELIYRELVTMKRGGVPIETPEKLNTTDT